MKKTKRIRVFMSILMALLFLIAGCAKTPNNSGTSSQVSSGDPNAFPPLPEFSGLDLGGKTISFASWYNLAPQESSDTYVEQQDLLASIEEKYNCKVEFVTGGDWHTYQSAMLISLMSGTKYADMFYLNFQHAIPQLTNAGFLTPLDNYFDYDYFMWNPEWNDMYKMKDGTHYGISSESTALGHVILFNKRIISERGISDTELYDLQRNGEWTWDKMVELAQQCTWDSDNDGETDIWGFGAYGTSPVCPEPFFYANGSAPVLMDENFKFTFNMDSEPCMEALNYCFSMVWDKNICYMGSKDWGTWENLWKEGKIAFFSVASWNMGGYNEVLAEDEFGILMHPKGPRATDYVNAFANPGAWFMQSVIPEADRAAIAAVLTEYAYPGYDFRNNQYSTWRSGNAARLIEGIAFDEGSIETANMAATRSVSTLGETAIWFRDNVLWNDCGLKDAIPPSTFVESIKAPSIESFEELVSD